MRHGYKGAVEMAATVDYLFGYDATADLLDDWMYERLADAYLFDDSVRDFLRRSNPWAERGMIERLLEAAERPVGAAGDGNAGTAARAVHRQRSVAGGTTVDHSCFPVLLRRPIMLRVTTHRPLPG